MKKKCLVPLVFTSVLALGACGEGKDAYDKTTTTADATGISRLCLGALRNTPNLNHITEESTVVRTNCKDDNWSAIPQLVTLIKSEKDKQDSEDTRSSFLIGGVLLVGFAGLACVTVCVPGAPKHQ